jgi:hypothetical protein
MVEIEEEKLIMKRRRLAIEEERLVIARERLCKGCMARGLGSPFVSVAPVIQF